MDSSVVWGKKRSSSSSGSLWKRFGSLSICGKPSNDAFSPIGKVSEFQCFSREASNKNYLPLDLINAIHSIFEANASSGTCFLLRLLDAILERPLVIVFIASIGTYNCIFPDYICFSYFL